MITHKVKSSTIELPWTMSSWRNHVEVKVKVTLRLTVSQAVSLGVDAWQLRSCFCGTSSLTRGRVCLLYKLLALASAVFLESESLGTRDHILLSHIWDISFRRLLRLAGSRWSIRFGLHTGNSVEQSRAQQSGSLLPATSQQGHSWHWARWNPWPYICSMSRLFSSFVVPPYW
jgi:hypothetical protein